MNPTSFNHHAEQSSAQPDVITHPGVYHLSSSNQHYEEYPQPAMTPPMFMPSGYAPNAVYQNDSIPAESFAQYYAGNQYFQSYPTAQNQGYHIPGMPISPGDVNPDFFQSVPPPPMPQTYGQFDESHSRNRGHIKRGRGRAGRGGRGGHGQWETSSANYVESQEYYHNPQRGQPQQNNSKGRGGRGQYSSASSNQRDMRYGNGDGRHVNAYHNKRHYNNNVDSGSSKGTQYRAAQSELEEAANTLQEHNHSKDDDTEYGPQSGGRRNGQNNGQGNPPTFSKFNPSRERSGASFQSGREETRDSSSFKNRGTNKSRQGKNVEERDTGFIDPGQSKLPFNPGQAMRHGYNDRKKSNSRVFSKEYASDSPTADKDESQRGSLTDQLTRNQYECMVCCDIIRVESAVWSCQNCHHVFHLHCIKKWARSSIDQDSQSWRCPGCQNESSDVPNKYRCFCGRRKDPQYVRGETPHSCGETCKKKRKGNCKHPCTLLCHPGPCPPCSSNVNQACDCGQVRKTLRCAMAAPFKCDKACGKQLPCDQHTCDKICHSGSCDLCTVSKSQECYCGKGKRDVFCGTVEYKRISFSCEKSCGRLLSCGNHLCETLCHPGECSVCERQPGILSTCACGKAPLKELESAPERLSCLDPVPTCGQICGKLLKCGPPEHHHTCEAKCHDGECGPCADDTWVRCECGAVEKAVACEVAVNFSAEAPFKCQKRCGKKKTCGRHKCSDTCCMKDVHICELVCGRKLACNLHTCEQLCHRSSCGRCMQTSFEELTCFCGGEILDPPIPCGTRVPECRRTCTRSHDCDHPVRHNCHSDDVCPPCIELTERMCMGGHVLRKNIPCHMGELSCGMPCNKSLPCGMHRCQKPCHKPPCLEEGASCTQPCPRTRTACSHMCKAPCHTGKCPDTPCKTEITISCPCGNKTSKALCGLGGDQLTELAQFQHLSVKSMAESGFQGVDMAQFAQSKKSNKRLECDVNCALKERNKRMALALEIKNPDLGAKLGQPNFSEFLKDFAKEKKNQALVLNVEKSLGDLVQTAKQSSQSNRSHALPPMNRDQRRMVHELAECYGCETKSYDYEPNKNVVVTAFGEKCWLPNITLSQHVFGDQLPKAPPPLSGLKLQGVNFTTLKKKESASEPAPANPTASSTSTSTRAWENVSASSTSTQAKKPPAVDYFDFTTN